MTVENNLDFDQYEDFTYGKKGYNDRKLTEIDKVLMDMYNSVRMENPTIGSVHTLKYVKSNSDYHMFDGGFKDYVRVDNKNTESVYINGIESGSSMDVLVTSIKDTPFMIKGSVSSIYQERVQKELTSMTSDEYIYGYIKDSNPAGYTVEFTYNGVNLIGFMPNTLAGVNRLSNPESIVGKTMELSIESYSEDEGTYIVSRRKYLQTLIPKEMDRLEKGELYLGTVTGTTDFGIFVEFKECLTGLIHKSNMNTDYDLSDIKPGVGIEFYVKEIIKDKIILTQVLKETLWDTIDVGQVYKGIVKDVKNNGVLVILDNETMGMVKISEIEDRSVRITNGDFIEVVVNNVDRSQRKIFLSLRR